MKAEKQRTVSISWENRNCYRSYTILLTHWFINQGIWLFCPLSVVNVMESFSWLRWSSSAVTKCIFMMENTSSAHLSQGFGWWLKIPNAVCSSCPTKRLAMNGDAIESLGRPSVVASCVSRNRNAAAVRERLTRSVINSTLRSVRSYRFSSCRRICCMTFDAQSTGTLVKWNFMSKLILVYLYLLKFLSKVCRVSGKWWYFCRVQSQDLLK